MKDNLQNTKDKAATLSNKAIEWSKNCLAKLDVVFTNTKNISKYAIVPINISIFLFSGLTGLFEYGTIGWKVCDWLTLACFIASLVVGILAGTYKILPLMARAFAECFGNLLIFGGGFIGVCCLNVIALGPLFVGGIKMFGWFLILSFVWVAFFCFPAIVVWYYILTENRINNSK